MIETESNSSGTPLPPVPHKREGILGKLAEAAGVSIVYGIFYVLLTVLLIAVIEDGAFSGIETARLTDTGLWSLKLMYGYVAAFMFGAAGMLLAGFSRRRSARGRTRLRPSCMRSRAKMSRRTARRPGCWNGSKAKRAAKRSREAVLSRLRKQSEYSKRARTKPPTGSDADPISM